MIRLEKLCKAYNDEVQIGPLNLEIPKASFTALVGPNGAGKSTCLMMIGRLLEADSGRVYLEGQAIDESKSQDLAKKIAVLRQENHFMTRLTVRQLVAFGRFPYSKGRLTAKDLEIVDNYIHFLSLDHLADRYLDQLSGGQRQRAYVAMVLAQETPYVLLDEPLNNLDIASSIQMMMHLRQVVNQLDRTIITVLHDINIAARYADFICAMKKGQIASFGSPRDVMQTQQLQRIFDANIRVIESEAGPIAVY